MQQGNSLIAVFEAISASGEVSRAALSEMTGFSLMTVGKVVDKLISCGIVTEKKLTGGGVGRKSGICALDKARGMILFDLTDTPRVRVCDIANNIIGEHTDSDVGELMLWAMNTLFEAGCSQIMGTAVVASRENVKAAHEFQNVLGITPDVVIEANRASAYANSARFNFSGAAFFLRVDAGSRIDGSIMLGGVPYHGASGHAGEFDKLGLTLGAFADKLSELCHIFDPELIHIACDDPSAVSKIEAELLSSFSEHGFADDARADVIVKPSENCRDALEGAAIMLRQKYVLLKIPNNT